MPPKHLRKPAKAKGTAANQRYNSATMKRSSFFWLLASALLLTACGTASASALSWNALPTPTAVPLHVPTITPAALTPTANVVAPLLPPLPTATPRPALTPTSPAPYIYYTQAGDTLPALAARFGVAPTEIQSNHPLPPTGLLSPNTMLIIPRRLGKTTSNVHLIPDSEVVYSPSAIGFDIQTYITQANGYLATYHEYLQSSGTTSGADIVTNIALNNSINPRLLLALLEYQGHWVSRYPEDPILRKYPLRYINSRYHRLYRQLAWAVNQLSIGYYGWREGSVTRLTFGDGSTIRLAPDLNAGTVAIAYFFSRLSPSMAAWQQTMDAQHGFPAFYTHMFGDPWARAYMVEPLYPPNLTQPPLILPIQKGTVWFFTGGPHGAWEHDGARAALDFAPGSEHGGCEKSRRWAVAVASGVVVRSGDGVVVLDLDGDGKEQTGWDILYLHIADEGRVPAGARLQTGDFIGHPSCKGGIATGTHIHIARKYNGEWIAADGPVPFVMDGWVPHAGKKPYEGTLTKGDKTVVACPCGSEAQEITRDDDDAP